MKGSTRKPGMYGGLPVRHGYSWNEEEIRQLGIRRNKGWSIEQLAEKHQRTVNAIKCALKDKESDLIINGTNYTQLLFCAKGIIHYKIQLTAALGHG